MQTPLHSFSKALKGGLRIIGVTPAKLTLLISVMCDDWSSLNHDTLTWPPVNFSNLFIHTFIILQCYPYFYNLILCNDVICDFISALYLEKKKKKAVLTFRSNYCLWPNYALYPLKKISSMPHLNQERSMCRPSTIYKWKQS